MRAVSTSQWNQVGGSFALPEDEITCCMHASECIHSCFHNEEDENVVKGVERSSSICLLCGVLEDGSCLVNCSYHLTPAVICAKILHPKATSGLGAAAAQALAKEGFTIVLVGRTSKMLSKITAEIRKSNEEAHIKAFEVDISSFCSILHFKESLQKWLRASNMHLSVQLLINNAGILATSPRKNVEGYDEMMATNYIGAFCLTQLLLPLLINSPVPSRIVNVTSFTHRAVSLVQADREAVVGECFLRSKQYPFAEVYQYSKFCLLLFSYALHWQIGLSEESSHVSVIPADPGVVETNIMREVPPLLSSSAFVLLKLLGLLQSPDVGVRSIIDAALAPPETSGVYFFGGNGQTLNSSSLSYNEKLVRELWDTSYDLFKELERAYEVS